MIACTGLARIEGVVDVLGDGFDFRTVDLVRVILGHGLFDEARQFLDGPIAMERIVVFSFDAFAALPMAFGAVLPVNRATLGGMLGADKAALKTRGASE